MASGQDQEGADRKGRWPREATRLCCDWRSVLFPRHWLCPPPRPVGAAAPACRQDGRLRYIVSRKV